MKALLTLALCLYTFGAHAASRITLDIDGKNYSCTESANDGKCACRAKGSYTNFFVNGVEAKYWNGSGGDQMVDCAEHLKAQSYCEGSVVDCSCKAEGSYTSFYVNGAQVRYWNGSGGAQMVGCEEYLQTQKYCR